MRGGDPEYRPHHVGVGADRVGRRVGQHAPLVEGDDPLGVAEHDVHVVLDLDDGADAQALRGGREGAAAARVAAARGRGKLATSGNGRARPSRASRTGPAPATSTPLKLTRPDDGAVSPASTLTSVVLPAPLGPMIDTNS